MSAPRSAARFAIELTAPTPAPKAPIACASSDWVWDSAPDSPPERPSTLDWVAAPLPADEDLPPLMTPDMPPASDHDFRNAAPEAVPGSTNASSRNRIIGQTAPMAMTMQPTTAMPACAVLEALAAAVSPGAPLSGLHLFGCT